MRSAYDFVIVGAGSAGCVLARRLSENPDVTVLVLIAEKASDLITGRAPLADEHVPYYRAGDRTRIAG